MKTKWNFLMILFLLVGLVGASARPAQAQASDPLTLSPTTLPEGQYATSYKQEVYITGGTAPYGGWVVEENSPMKLTHATGTGIDAWYVMGIPNSAGQLSFTVEVWDSANHDIQVPYTGLQRPE